MVGGKLRCLGGSQRLRSLYGRGYQIEMNHIMPSSSELSNILSVIIKSCDLLSNSANKDIEDGEQYSHIDQCADFLLSKSQVVESLKACGKSEWVKRIDARSDLITDDPDSVVNAKIFASWWFFESIFDKTCDFFGSNYQDFVVKERQISKTRVEISGTDLNGNKRKLSNLFESLESNRLNLHLQEYSVTQVSLEQIFNHFAAQQEEETGKPFKDNSTVKLKPLVPVNVDNLPKVR